MNGEVALGGVFVPTLLLLATLALVVTVIVIRFFAYFGVYRFLAYRALVDLCLYILILGLLAVFAPSIGIHP